MAASMNPQIIEIFDNFIGNLNLVKEQLKENDENDRSDNGFNLDKYWDRLGQSVKAVSKEGTKLMMMFSEPPLPTVENVEQMVSTMERATLAMISVYYTLPKSHGKSLYKSTQAAILSVVEGVKSFTESLKAHGCSGSQVLLNQTGNLWKSCEAVEKAPRNNKFVVLNQCKDTMELVNDALVELEEALNDEGDGEIEDLDSENSECWTEHDRKFIAPCIGLIKCARGFLKKFSGTVKSCDISDSTTVIQLDDISDNILKISPAIDDLAMSLYPPIDQDAIISYVVENSEILKACVELAKRICEDSDIKWLDMVSHAIDHNVQKARLFGK